MQSLNHPLPQIPETPQWLLSKNRVREAKKSLRWLRGWVSNDSVSQEFYELQRHNERSKSCNACVRHDLPCSHPAPTLAEKLAELKKPRTFKPFIIVLILFLVAQFTGDYAMRPVIIQIFKAYKSPIPPDQAATIMSFFDNVGNLGFMCLLRFTGKRKLYLSMATGVFLSSFIISMYGFIYLPAGYTSFDLEEPHDVGNQNLTYIPLVCLCFWSFFSYCGFLATPWMLLAELFSFKQVVFLRFFFPYFYFIYSTSVAT